MKLIAYGEDALTLWALTSKLSVILTAANDTTSVEECVVFYRPSFGRRGGSNRSEFGEFDFILLTNQTIYLGESKWNRSSEKKNGGKILLRAEQRLRHKLFAFYIHEWAFGRFADWNDFSSTTFQVLGENEITKPVPSSDSLLAQNIQTVMREIKEHFSSQPKIINLLLYFYDSGQSGALEDLQCEDFRVQSINYQSVKFGQHIQINI